MTAIKDTSAISAKWQRRAATAGVEYEEGVKNPRSPWDTATAGAEKNYVAGVQAAISRGSFGKGVRKTGHAGWQKAATEKGPARYAQGVNLAGDKYQSGFAPFADTIKALNLPPRGPKGDPNNITRVGAIAKALHDKKLQLQGS